MIYKFIKKFSNYPTLSKTLNVLKLKNLEKVENLYLSIREENSTKIFQIPVEEWRRCLSFQLFAQRIYSVDPGINGY